MCLFVYSFRRIESECCRLDKQQISDDDFFLGFWHIHFLTFVSCRVCCRCVCVCVCVCERARAHVLKEMRDPGMKMQLSFLRPFNIFKAFLK